MLTTTRDMILPTAITGSYPRPLWFEANLGGRSFKTMMGDSLFREQYLDAVAAIINPVKFGAICAPALSSMLWDEHYHDDHALVLDLCDIMNAEFKELAAAGCPVIQVEEPRHHGLSTLPECTDKDLEFQTEAFNRQLAGVDSEIWVHTCWGNPNQQRVYWEVPSYERALPHLLQLNAEPANFECGRRDGKDLTLFGK